MSPIKIFIIPSWYKNDSNFMSGNFFYEHGISISQHEGIESHLSFVKNFNLLNWKNYKIETGYQKKTEMNFTEEIDKLYNISPGIKSISRYLYYKKVLKLYYEYKLKNGKPDIIHAHCVLFAGWIAMKIAEKEEIPYILTLHSSGLLSTNNINNHRKIISLVLNKAKVVTAVSHALKMSISFLRKDILVIPNAVNTDFFEIKKNKKNENVFFSLAFLHKEKNMELLIKAFNQALAINKNLKLYIGGGGIEFRNLKSLIESLKLDSKVILLGSLTREEVKNWMEYCDVFVLSSNKETFGIVYIEAMAAGKPVIATKCGGPEEFVKTFNGLLIEKENQNQLAKSLLKILDIKYNNQEIKNYAHLNFGFETISRRYIGIYKEMLKSR